MPLPDAGSPSDSRVYRQSTGKTLDSLTVENLETISDPVFVDRNSEDELRRINLVGQASNLQSQSGAIPGTGKIEQISGSYSSGVYTDVFTPGSKEVWEIVSADFNATLSSGTVDSVQLFVSVGGTAVMIGENTGDNFDTFKDFFASPILVDENMTVQARASDSNITALAVRLLLIRVR